MTPTPDVVSLVTPTLQTPAKCEYCHQDMPAPPAKYRHNKANLKARRFCDNKCRAMKWKLDHPETWSKAGTPISIGGDKRHEWKGRVKQKRKGVYVDQQAPSGPTDLNIKDRRAN